MAFQWILTKYLMIHGVGCRDANKTSKTNSALRYALRVIAHVNKEEENAEGQKRNTMTGTVKVSGLIQRRSNQSDPKLAWEMFHNIYHMYIDIKNKEEINVALLLTRMSGHEDINKVRKTTVNSHENHHNEYPFEVRTIVPPDLYQIQPISNQVWNCDETRLDPNSKWRNVVCNYK